MLKKSSPSYVRSLSAVVAVGAGIAALSVMAQLVQIKENKGCPKDYISVPGSSLRHTSTFCVMKYEAKKKLKDRVLTPVSQAAELPWAFISLDEARAACKSLGSAFHLLTNAEYLTIADSIAATKINDVSPDVGMQFPTGNTDRQRGPQGAISVADPKISDCDISRELSDPKNAYVQGSCELRGAGTDPFTVKGYFSTDQQWSTTGYVAGQPNSSQLRTLVLANGQVIWDLAGNVWERVDAPLVYEGKTGSGDTFYDDSDGITGDLPVPNTSPTTMTWFDYKDIKQFKSFSDQMPINQTWTSANGTGEISLGPGLSWDDDSQNTTTARAVVRGGAYGNINYGGIYSYDLALGPTYRRDYVGFRCAK